ncbi:hypothetical protein L3X37_02775 [Sabulilitoribacter arenilitoris]|uniref:Uncharacterized protein n=1 Tax=Wocania arenilitoris TaxID=2044858 RepID=A0AAE3ENE6_9FLAO|nr:hypothetical protein [Wocania arenilitoris]MCF7567289.1 hypothetical protein [Wocania arenilitoris]
MKPLIALQESEAYDAGYNIGYTIGKYLPLVVVIVIAYLIYRYIKNKSKK